MASCGGSEDEPKDALDLPVATAASESPGALQTAPSSRFLPCHVDLTKSRDPVASASQIPEVVRIQMLERPYRIVPNDIVLEQNKLYRLVIEAGSEWHTFRLSGFFDKDLNFELPPGSQAEALVRPLRPGIAEINDPRYFVRSRLNSTITIVPEGMTASSWLPSCARISVSSPPAGAALSTPLVVQGSVEHFIDIDLQINRVEAWVNGALVGSTAQVQSNPHEWQVDFILPVPDLPSGTHTLILTAYYQNGAIAATATMPLDILSGSPQGTVLPGYVGNIDLPGEGEMLKLPVSIQGWVVIPGREVGAGVESVEIWNGRRETGTLLAEATYGSYRPDVAQALDHPPYVSSGFFAQLANLPSGYVDLHVYVRDRKSGDYVNPRIRQAPLTRRVSLVEGKVIDADWPVALAAAPDGRLFFAELLTGNIRILERGRVLPMPFATVEGVSNHGESGLTGLALHPNFLQLPYVYAMYVANDPNTGLPQKQRIVRYRDNRSVGRDYTVLIDDLPATTTILHNGGRIAFGPDGKLYVSIGDTDVPDLAQDPNDYAGALLRFNPDGSIPEDNPYPGSPVYAIGFRNVFGFAFQPDTGNLYATENGPGGFDEVNQVRAGQNYGWPLHMGITSDSGIVDPVAVFGTWPQPAYAPTGVTFDPKRNDILLFCAYRNVGLHALELSGPDHEVVVRELHLSSNCMLDVTYSNDGWLYYSTVSAIYRARLDDLLRLQEQNSQ